MNILQIITERYAWSLARPYPYAITWGIEEALVNLGHNVYPLVHQVWGPQGVNGHDKWFDLLDLYKDINFDVLIIDAMHGQPSIEVLKRLEKIAPRRIALLTEAMTTPQCYGIRESEMLDRLKYFTEALALDSYDVDYINIPTHFFGCHICKSSIRPQTPAEIDKCVFIGKPYDIRRKILDSIKDIDTPPPPGEGESVSIYNKEALLANAYMDTGNYPMYKYQRYINNTRKARKDIHNSVLDLLCKYKALVALPSTIHAYTSRVAEAMAVGIPVIQWKIPDRPEILNMFKDREEILLFEEVPADVGLPISDLSSLRECLDMVSNTEARNRIGLAGQKSIRTTEKLLEDILSG